MSLVLALVLFCSLGVWASPFGMYYGSGINVLEMVPPAEIYSTTTMLDRNFIQAVFCSKLELQHNISTPKACLRGDQQPDPLQSKMGNLTIDFFLNPFAPAKLSFPPPGKDGFHFTIDKYQYTECTRPTAISATGATRAPWVWLSRLTLLDPKPDAWRASLHAAVTSWPTAMLDVLMHMQLAMIYYPVLALLLAVLLAALMFLCAVCLDVAAAIVGLACVIASAPPTIHVHAISCFMSMCMRIILSRLMVKVFVLIYLATLLPTCLAVGTTDPKVNENEYALPGVAMWNGIPHHNFRIIWWVTLCAALGNIAQYGWSLLQTARDQDLGGPTLGGTPNQRTQSQNRNQRLFGAMLKYIEPNSWVYRYVHRTFANNGRGLFNYLWVYGYLPYTSDERAVLENEWNDATMSSANIKYTPEAVFKWAEFVSALADKLNKSERDKRVKYLAGFPTSFNVLIVSERTQGAIGSYTHPANFPAHHPNAGAAHPLAGQPDIHATALAFYTEWARMIRTGEIKSVPRGMVNRADEDDDDDVSDENQTTPRACMVRDRISAYTICLICGGAGHAGYVDGLGQCLSARLDNRIPAEDLAQFKYPNGYRTAPRFRFSNSRPSSSNSRPSDDQDSNPSHPRTRQYTRQKARAIEPPTSDESQDEEESKETRTTRDNKTAYRTTRDGKQTTRERTRSSSTRTRKSNRNVRHVKIDDRDASQNVTSDADHSSDADEHAQLAVAYDAVVF